MAIWISRYSNKELQSGKYYPVGISIGTPKFPLGYTHKALVTKSFLTRQRHCMRSCTSEPRRMRAMIISIRYSQTYASDERNTLRVSIGR